MSVVHVKLVRVTKGNSGDGFAYANEYEVKLSADETGGIDAAQVAVDPNTGVHLPNYLDAWTDGTNTNLYAGCYALDGEQKVSEDRKSYRFTAKYGTLSKNMVGAKPNQPSDLDQPWTKRAKWSFGEFDYTIPATRAAKGSPVAATEEIRNLNGQRYDPPPERTYSNQLIRVTWWEATVDLDRMDSYRNKVNDATFWGYAARRLRVNSFTAEEIYEYGRYFGEYQIEIEVNCEPAIRSWVHQALETGSKVKASAGATELSLPTFNGVQTTDDVLLAADGTQLAPGGTPEYTFWYIEPQIDFTGIGLPTPGAHIVFPGA